LLKKFYFPRENNISNSSKSVLEMNLFDKIQVETDKATVLF